MDRVYRLCVMGKHGMYTQGQNAATPELARQAVGTIICDRQAKLGIVSQERLPGLWGDSAGNQHQRYADSVLVDVEPEPGTWEIGKFGRGQINGNG